MKPATTEAKEEKLEKVSPSVYLNEKAATNLVYKNHKVYDELFDVEYAKALTRNILHFINEVYFRPTLIGFDEMPDRRDTKRPIIFVSNHSGMAFPWDAVIFKSALFEKENYQKYKVVRALIAPILSEKLLMNPFMVDNLLKKVGGVDATYRNFETMMSYPDSHLLIYPEGILGIGKGFNNKYQLQRLATSFVRMSLKYKADIQPFSTINGEYINPYTYSFDAINKQSAKLGIPFIPVGVLTIFLLFQPWLFYYAWPAKLTFVRGRRIKPYKLLDKDFEDVTEEEIIALRDRICEQMQLELNEAVATHGQKRFHLKELFAKMWEHKRLFPFYLPFGWPFVFKEFERLCKKSGGKNLADIKLDLGWGSLLKMLFRNPIIACYFIPILGWIPLIIIGFRSPTTATTTQQTKTGKWAVLLTTLVTLFLAFYVLM